MKKHQDTKKILSNTQKLGILVVATLIIAIFICTGILICR